MVAKIQHSISYGSKLLTPELIAELRTEMEAFRSMVDTLQEHFDKFEALYGKRKRRLKTSGFMRARATGKRKIAG